MKDHEGFIRLENLLVHLEKDRTAVAVDPRCRLLASVQLVRLFQASRSLSRAATSRCRKAA
jgi:hypothetical protein